MRIRALWIMAMAVTLPLTPARSLPAESSEEAASVAEADARSFRWVGQDGGELPFADEEAALEFLNSAEVVERETIEHGVTRPQLLMLEKDGIRARAVFHDIDVEKPRERLASGDIVFFFRDSYRNNVAVYELSRLLGVPNVPPAVVRRLGRDEGSVQLWVEDAYNNAERRERPLEVLPLGVRRRMTDMRVFDNLINNIDRNDGNMLFDALGRFWMIDHTRTLSRTDKLPSPDSIRTCSRDLFEAMRALDETETRERLAPYLNSFELDALFSRRDKLVELIDEKISKNGAKNVLFSYD